MNEVTIKIELSRDWHHDKIFLNGQDISGAVAAFSVVGRVEHPNSVMLTLYPHKIDIEGIANLTVKDAGS